MFKACLILFLVLLGASCSAQYYLRGEVRDEQGHNLANVKFLILSKGNFPYYTGAGGGFGIPSKLKTDSITIFADGFEVFIAPVRAGQYEVFTLKMTSVKANSSRLRLASFTRNLFNNKRTPAAYTGESYSSTIENDFVEALHFPETGFAINVDRASYSNIRRLLNHNEKPPPEAVRVEEMLNYFNFSNRNKQDSNSTFCVNTTFTNCPWNEKNSLLFMNLQAKKISLEKTPPSNLVFLIDVSGSMDMPNRLPLLISGFKLMVENLRAIDTVSIISYANGVSIMLEPTPGNNKQKIIEALEGLTPSGATSGEAAIVTAYRFAAANFIPGGNNRVLLATDGDFNVGLNSEKDLEELIAKQRQTGIYLTCIGVGMGNYKDSKLEALAKKGNGNFAYLDNEQEAEKVLVEEFSQTLFTVANNVFMNVRFNPHLVKRYRLIGFDNKESAIADSTTWLEGGEVGSGHSLLSVFEMEIDSAQRHQPATSLAELKLTYTKQGDTSTSTQLFQVPNEHKRITSADSSLQFASAIIMFGGLLKQSRFMNIGFDEVYNLALPAVTSGSKLQHEFLELVQKAKKIYGKKSEKISVHNNVVSLTDEKCSSLTRPAGRTLVTHRGHICLPNYGDTLPVWQHIVKHEPAMKPFAVMRRLVPKKARQQRCLAFE